MRSSGVLNLWRRFRAQSGKRKALLLEAIVWLAVARLAILVLPFPRIARYLGKLRAPAEQANHLHDEPAVANDVSWAVERAALALPVRLVCFPRALAGWQMLHRRQIAGKLHFGAYRDKNDTRMRTHAWLDASGVEVTGYPEAHLCVELGYFER